VDAPDSPGLGGGRWIVAPDSREPWLPGAAVVLWACVRAARGGPGNTPGAARDTEDGPLRPVPSA
jgi:hypothetical protein